MKAIDNIETKRFILRQVNINDNEDIFEILSNEKVIPNLNMDIHKSIEDTNNLIKEYEEGLEKNEKFPFAIIDKETKAFLGVFLVKLDLYDEDCYEFTIYLKEDYWGNGIYTEITPYMVKFAFEVINTGNVRGFVKESNIASRKVLEKLGFKLEKIFDVPGINQKIYSYLVINDDYEDFKNKYF